MPLPQSDIPKSVSVTIEVGDQTYTIENNGFTIEIHDARDPMGQPTTFQHDGDTITGILEAVDSVLQVELNGDGDCDCEEEIEDSIHVHVHSEPMGDPVIDNFIRNHVNALRGNQK